MEYQKIIKLLDDTINQPTKFRTRNWVEINNESRRACNNDDDNNSNIKFRIIVMHSCLLKELQKSRTRQLQVRQ